MQPIDFSQRKDHTEGLDALFIERWSPRSFARKAIPEDIRNTIFDAARFAPSAYNAQPWRIFASTEETLPTYLGLLLDMNQTWAQNASILGFMVAAKHFEHNGQPNPFALYDCGSAWMSLTFQARKLGLYTHGMAGVHFDEVYRKLEIPQEKYTVVAGFAIGYLDAREKLPEALRTREQPSPRKPLGEIVLSGKQRLT